MKLKIFLLLLVVIPFKLTSQSFYILGKISKSQEGKIFNLFDRAVKKNKKILLYINGVEKINRIKLSNLNEFNSIKEKINLYEIENNVQQYILNVNSKNSNKTIKLIYQFESIENNYSIPTMSLNEASKNVELNKNDIFIIYLNKSKITVDYSNLKNNMIVNTSNYEINGIVNSNSEILKIQYKLNNETWKDVDFALNRNTIYDFSGNVNFTKIGLNSLTLKITDIDNTITLFPFEKINYTQIVLSEKNCRFVSPNKFGNNVEKRIFDKRSDAIVYWFKIETSANLDGLNFVRCDRNKNTIIAVPLRDKYVPSAENYYCFGLTRDELKLGDSDCEFSQKGLDLLSWIYIQDNSNNSKGEMIPVVFSTITSDQNKRQQILRAECVF